MEEERSIITTENNEQVETRKWNDRFAQHEECEQKFSISFFFVTIINFATNFHLLLFSSFLFSCFSILFSTTDKLSNFTSDLQSL